MGNFRIEIEAVGGHGCQRDKKDGEHVFGCQLMSCPDCNARRFLSIVKNILGCSIVEAKLIHWPGQQGSVTDDLVSGIRKGNF